MGDVSVSQTLHVEGLVEDTTAALTNATGNAFSAAVEVGSLNVRSRQTLQGSVNASTELDVTQGSDTGYQTSLTTAATGNAGDASALSGGALEAQVRQDVDRGAAVTASSWMEARQASSGDLSSNTQALGNTQGLAAVGGSITSGVTQDNEGNVSATGGGAVQYIPATAAFSSTAVGNNITSTGVVGSTGTDHTINTLQSQTGERVESSNFVAVGNGQTVSSAATSSGNNLSASNEYGFLDVNANQDNASLVNADAEIQINMFGTAAAVASGVGNSVIAGENGGEVYLDNTQTNRGDGVFASASAGGVNGYDLSASATAMGNAVTGYACSECGGRMTVSNSQTNASNVGASTATRTSSWARSVSSVATAVGNSASFYVSAPGQ